MLRGDKAKTASAAFPVMSAAFTGDRAVLLSRAEIQNINSPFRETTRDCRVWRGPAASAQRPQVDWWSVVSGQSGGHRLW